jgi:hypothetical protein
MERNVKLRSAGSVDWLGGGVCGCWPPLPCAHVAAARTKKADTTKNVVLNVVLIWECERRTSIAFLSCLRILEISNSVLVDPEHRSWRAERSFVSEATLARSLWKKLFGIVK